ncbi:MAG: hypothetical protein Q4F24_08185 [Eubacteriales bacterium]|nr:hypothetical protein [Eubacteriales bacterium]
MKQKYSERPQETWLEVLHNVPGGACVVHFNENVIEVPAESEEAEPQFEADYYSFETAFRNGLEESVSQNREIWLAAAMKKEIEEKNLTLEERVKNLETMQDDLTLAILGV